MKKLMKNAMHDTNKVFSNKMLLESKKKDSYK